LFTCKVPAEIWFEVKRTFSAFLQLSLNPVGGTMQRIILVSNRLPVTVEKKKGELHFRNSTGGLATGLDSFHQNRRCLWIGWPGLNRENISISEEQILSTRLMENRCVPVNLSRNDMEKFYYGFSNKTIWPLFHYFPQHTLFHADFWDSYVHVNNLYAQVVMANAEKGDMIWIHDYQLMLLPAILREKMPDADIGFFLHIPFPSLELFRLLPWRNEILEGLLGADLIGFHTYDYIRHFLNSVRRLLGHENTFSTIEYRNRFIKVDVFPMGIDYTHYSTVGTRQEVLREERLIRRKTGNCSLIIAIDRLDYTKGIIQRLDAFDLFLSKNPRMREKVILILVAVPSRSSVESYRQLKNHVDEKIGSINGRHGTIGWTPVMNLYRSIPFATLAALYYTCEIALITPLRDGMNLVAKEYVATKQQGKDGVLILSEMAGAAREMGEAIIVNPNNKEEIANALVTALEMSREEKLSRITSMQKRLARYDVRRWANDFIGKLEQVRLLREKLQSKRLTGNDCEKILSEYRNASRALFLLDYDGTLVPFAGKPEKAIPDDILIKLLESINAGKGNTVALVSGRDRGSLDRWFSNSGLVLCAEHGVWIKKPSEEWTLTVPQQNTWKNELRPILELFVDRTPGSLLEEKEYSLAFHYRNADPELASIRVRELMDALIQQVSNLNLGVLEGNRVIEIKNAGVNKGAAAMEIIGKDSWDFILAAGDDITDENMFSSLPEEACSIKVGMGPSRASFNVESTAEMRRLLSMFLVSDAQNKTAEN
jgi:trehalose 6-phosphate synthase/phosphatase